VLCVGVEVVNAPTMEALAIGSALRRYAAYREGAGQCGKDSRMPSTTTASWTENPVNARGEKREEKVAQEREVQMG